jgi:hypothetical protein
VITTDEVLTYKRRFVSWTEKEERPVSRLTVEENLRVSWATYNKQHWEIFVRHTIIFTRWMPGK